MTNKERIDEALREIIKVTEVPEATKLAQDILDNENVFGALMMITEVICKASPEIFFQLMSRVCVRVYMNDIADFLVANNEDIPKEKMN